MLHLFIDFDQTIIKQEKRNLNIRKDVRGNGSVSKCPLTKCVTLLNTEGIRQENDFIQTGRALQIS